VVFGRGTERSVRDGSALATPAGRPTILADQGKDAEWYPLAQRNLRPGPLRARHGDQPLDHALQLLGVAGNDPAEQITVTGNGMGLDHLRDPRQVIDDGVGVAWVRSSSTKASIE
jgi:hypothetical protein